MRLKRVELFGFKSFADKTVFDFSSGITAILGPNGCGKSNVVDAVKWVLGEQSAKSLRGSEMADVIFAGSETRRPTGMAEVSLVFDNEEQTLPIDYREVCVTRRLYRSGESEYLINKQRCLRRDITGLFLDTGVGTTAYSFIEQGKVEALLAAKPHERRAVFEEAAGVSRYKATRKEALRRLDRTEQYLLRVHDIVEEVEKRIRSVARQAGAARRFQRLTDELRAARGQLYARRWRAETDRRDALGARADELDALRAEEERRAGLVGGVIAELQQSELAVEAEIGKAGEARDAVREQAAALEAEQARVGERRQALRREAEQAAETAAALDERLRGFDAERDELDAAKTALAAEVERLAEAVAEAETDHQRIQNGLDADETELEEARKSLAAIQSEQADLNAAVARLDAEEESLRARRERLERDRAEADERTRALADGVEEAARAEQAADAAHADLRERLAAARAGLEAARAEAQSAADAHAEAERRQSSAAGRLETLRDLEAGLAGLHQGVKAVMEAKRSGGAACAGVEGLVADLLVATPEHAVAIETALGSAQQNVVTRTAADARDAIEHLKQNRAGRATFLPLDRIRPRRRLDAALAREDGVVGEAIDLVRYDPAYTTAAEYLLAGTLVVEDLDRALALRDGAGRGVRMVTLDGDLVNPSGAMTGGRDARQKGGLVTRKSEIERLEAELRDIEAEVADALARRDAALARVREGQAAGASLETELGDAAGTHRDLAAALTAKRAELDRLRADAAESAAELEQLSERSQQLDTERSERRERLRAVGEREWELNGAVERLGPRIREARIEARQRGEELSAQRVALAGARQRLEETTRRRERMDRDVEERAAQREAARRRAAEAAEEDETLAATEAKLADDLGAALSRREDAEASVQTLRSNLAQVREELETRRNEERAANRKVAEAKEALGQVRMEDRESALRLESLAEKAREELEVDDLAAFAQSVEARIAAARAAEEAADAPDASADGAEAEADADRDDDADEEDDADAIARHDFSTLDDAAIEAAVRDLQEKIRRLGPVNHQAVDELAELRARREFLAGEEEDLRAARDDVDALVDRLNRECRRRFDETFEAVRENFQLLFRQLFGGGKADLVLEESEDPLEAGIEIIARPPGKEPSSISLLSGGEKALCAVALLFGIFRSKPSPFCILDEVDGPLDESNIDRYMTTLREFAAESQFIIITHSKRTMSMVEQIYGVTQSEPGVSRNMSLRFDHGDVVDDHGDAAAHGAA